MAKTPTNSKSPWRTPRGRGGAKPTTKRDREVVARAQAAIRERHPEAPAGYLFTRARFWRCSLAQAARRVLANYAEGWS